MTAASSFQKINFRQKESEYIETAEEPLLLYCNSLAVFHSWSNLEKRDQGAEMSLTGSRL